MGILRVMVRLPLVGIFLIFGILLCAFLLPSDWNKPGLLWQRNVVRRWLATIARLIGIRIRVNGTPSQDTALVVANHVSWMDILVIGATHPVSFLSKIEIAHWPIVGYLARRAGTLFINRGAGATAAIQIIKGRLHSEADVVLFPEGTTSDGTTIGRFHPRLFSSAIEAHVPVQPVFINYPCKDSGDAINPKAPYTSDMPFLQHALVLMAEPHIDADVHYTDTVYEASGDRKQLAEKTRELISAKQPTAIEARNDKPAHRAR